MQQIALIILCLAIGIVLRWSGRLPDTATRALGGWGNTSFVGLPMIAAFAGSQWLGLVIDLFGSYLALSTLGLAVATVASSGQFDWRAVGKRIATFPPFLAIPIAFATNHLERPDWLTQIFVSLADTLTPIALATVGYALRFDRIAALGVGLGYRLVLAPLAILATCLSLGQAGDPVAKVAMLEMAMPPMLGASIVAMDHELEPDLVALLIGVGVPLSMPTAWAWWSVIAAL